MYVFYELTTSYCVENLPRCQSLWAFRMSLLITFALGSDPADQRWCDSEIQVTCQRRRGCAHLAYANHVQRWRRTVTLIYGCCVCDHRGFSLVLVVGGCVCVCVRVDENRRPFHKQLSEFFFKKRVKLWLPCLLLW